MNRTASQAVFTPSAHGLVEYRAVRWLGRHISALLDRLLDPFLDLYAMTVFPPQSSMPGHARYCDPDFKCLCSPSRKRRIVSSNGLDEDAWQRDARMFISLQVKRGS